MSRCGFGDDHCCYLDGVVCPHLVDHGAPRDSDGRRYSCGLYDDLGDWDAVHADPRWSEVGVALDALEIPGVHRCDAWPPPGVTCATCGEVSPDG